MRLPIRFESEGLGRIRFSRPNASDISTRVFLLTSSRTWRRQPLHSWVDSAFFAAAATSFSPHWAISSTCAKFVETNQLHLDLSNAFQRKEKRQVGHNGNYSICKICALCVTIYYFLVHLKQINSPQNFQMTSDALRSMSI